MNPLKFYHLCLALLIRVSASLEKGAVTRFRVKSLKGADCLVHGDWKVTDAAGKLVATDRDKFGRLRFKTVAGGVYSLAQ